MSGEPSPGLRVSGEMDIDFRRGVQTGLFGAGFEGPSQFGVFSVAGAFRYARDRSLALSGDLALRVSPRYGFHWRQIHDLDDGVNVFQILARRYSVDHVIEFGMGLRDGDLELELRFEPAIGGVSTERRSLSFRDVPNLDPHNSIR